jgi:hypothetical protein
MMAHNKKLIYPKNKEHFKRLIPFAQKIISICREAGFDPVVYGSFAHFYQTKDKTMNVNDIDLAIPKNYFPKIVALLRKAKIKHKYYPQYDTCVVERGKLKVEIDAFSGVYKTLKEETLYEDVFDNVDFYGMPVKIITLGHLEDIYTTAYLVSTDNKQKILDRTKKLEKFLGRKLKQDITIEIIKNKNLTSEQKKIINKARVVEWGKGEEKDFSKDYEPETEWFFVKDKNKVVSIGGIRPIKIKYLGKTYSIGGICSTISVVKGKGYGKIMMSFMKNYSYRTGKTLLGFTTQTEFFKKAGLGTEKDFIKRFVYVKKNGEKVYDNDGDGIYYEGKDKIISKILKTKPMVEIYKEFW